MKLSVDTVREIPLPVEQVWQILAVDFEDVASWASNVTRSGPNPATPVPFQGATSGGRVCEVTGFGRTDERLTSFDEASRTFAYTVAAPRMPGFVHDMTNAWRVEQLDAGRSRVTSSASAELSGPLAPLFRPVMRRLVKRTLGVALDDLQALAASGRQRAA